MFIAIGLIGILSTRGLVTKSLFTFYIIGILTNSAHLNKSQLYNLRHWKSGNCDYDFHSGLQVVRSFLDILPFNSLRYPPALFY